MDWSQMLKEIADFVGKYPVDLAGAVAVVALLVSLWRFGVQMRRANVQRYVQIMLDAERSYETLHAKILEDAELTADYMALASDGPIPPCPRGTPSWQKRFVFWEMYYGHLCRVFTLHHVPRFNPVRSWRVSQQYWKLYENWLVRLVRHPVFVDVHEAAKRHGTYEQSFVETVDRIVRKTPRPS